MPAARLVAHNRYTVTVAGVEGEHIYTFTTAAMVDEVVVGKRVYYLGGGGGGDAGTQGRGGGRSAPVPPARGAHTGAGLPRGAVGADLVLAQFTARR